METFNSEWEYFVSKVIDLSAERNDKHKGNVYKPNL